MPVAKYVEKYGLNEWELSMDMIAAITKRNTGEYAIRAFIEKFPEKTLKKMLVWAGDENFHLRRLACEGIRPRLPWAKKLDSLGLSPFMIISILNTLKDDKCKYVQKSVANCLNDIFKDRREIGIQIIEDWSQDEISVQRKWIIKHALRNLLKNNDPWAIQIMAKDLNSI